MEVMKKSIWTVSIALFVSVFGCAGLADKNDSSASKTVGGPALRLDSKTIDLGTIPSGEDTIVGTIPIMNDGDDSEEIRMLRTELSDVMKELQLLRSDMKKVLAALGNAAPGCACAGAAAPSEVQPRPVDTNVYDVNIGSSPVLGKADAPVTITEWADFQCPFCAREYPKLKEILAAYPDKVRIVFKHRPLAFHKQAKPAHAAAQLAMEQGGSELFWKMHDRIIASPKALEVKDLRGYAEALNLDLARFDAVMADPKKIDQFLKLDLDEAAKCKVNATPTVMINGLKLSGDRSIESYKARIDGLLKSAAVN